MRVLAILLGVVVRVLHRQLRASGKRDRRDKAVVLLPVKAPVLDGQQRLHRAVGQRGGDAHVRRKVVRVRVDAQQIDRHRQLVGVGDDVVVLARGNVDELRSHLERERRRRRRPIGEEERNRRLNRARRIRREHVELDDEIGAAIETPGHAFGRHDGPASGRPADELAFRILTALPRHPVEARLAVLTVFVTRCLRRIDANDSVVNRRAVRLELERAHERARLERRAQHEIAIDVLRAGLQRVRPLGREHDVRTSRLPPVGEDGRLRKVGGIPFDLAVLCPLLDERDLVPPQPALADDRKLAAIGQPRRHVPAARFLHHAVSVLRSVRVTQQRERCDFARPVAGRAVRKDDGRDVLIERHGWCGGRGCAAAASLSAKTRRQERCADAGRS